MRFYTNLDKGICGIVCTRWIFCNLFIRSVLFTSLNEIVCARKTTNLQTTTYKVLWKRSQVEGYEALPFTGQATVKEHLIKWFAMVSEPVLGQSIAVTSQFAMSPWTPLISRLCFMALKHTSGGSGWLYVDHGKSSSCAHIQSLAR